jgi:hypothetical protein
VDSCFLRWVTSVSCLVIWFSLIFNSLSFSDREVCSISVSFCKFSMIAWFGVGVLAAFSVVFVFYVIPICVGWYGCFGRVTLLGDSTLSRLTVGVLIGCELGLLVCFSTCSGLDRILQTSLSEKERLLNIKENQTTKLETEITHLKKQLSTNRSYSITLEGKTESCKDQIW